MKEFNCCHAPNKMGGRLAKKTMHTALVWRIGPCMDAHDTCMRSVHAVPCQRQIICCIGGIVVAWYRRFRRISRLCNRFSFTLFHPVDPILPNFDPFLSFVGEEWIMMMGNPLTTSTLATQHHVLKYCSSSFSNASENNAKLTPCRNMISGPKCQTEVCRQADLTSLVSAHAMPNPKKNGCNLCTTFSLQNVMHIQHAPKATPSWKARRGPCRLVRSPSIEPVAAS